MNLHDILLTVQYITISVLFVEIVIVFSRWKNSLHSYLFFTCITSFISNLGYLLELKAECEEAYITALKLSYVGRVWIVFAYFLFSARMCRVRLRKGLIYFLMLVHVGIYLSVLTIGQNTLYYTNYEFISDPVYPKFYHGNGNLHDLLMGLNVVLIIVAMGWVIRNFVGEKEKKARMRLLMLILAFGVQAVFFILHVTAIFDISEFYDLTMPGTLFGSIFMLIGIFGFDLLGTREIARDFVIDRISEGIIAVDNTGKIQYYNEPVAKIYPEFNRFFALKRELGKKIGENKSGEYRTPYDIIAIIEEAVKNGETLKIGDKIYSPEENNLVHSGICYGKLYALVDDTEHYEYMEELEKQKNIADRANEAKSRFLANMSHEIRTPINAVLGMDEMILRESGEKSIRAYAADIMSAGKTLLSLINDILDLSKVEEGRMEIVPAQYDLSSLVNDLVNMIRDRAARKGLAFHVNVDEHAPNVLLGDEIRIRQCAMNLLTNAVKYTEKGEVRLTVTFDRPEPEKEKILLNVTVEDTGIGMKAEDMEDLFSPYKRIDEKKNHAIEGTGLGMSITRQLLELMGSELKVESEYGKGSVFSFAIEQEVLRWEEIGNLSDRYAQTTDSGYEYHELFHAPQAKILVVDDTEMNLTVIRGLLKKTEIGIDTAASGKEALNLTDQIRYDVIFIDHMMSDMDGIETLQAIRKSGENTETPAVALTANAVSGAREMYLAAGFTDYLSKPVDGKKLEKMLLEMLPGEKVQKGVDRSSGPKETEKCREEDLPLWLKENADIDVPTGLKNCGSAESYLSVLAVFHQTAPSKVAEIEELFEKNDIENYTIKVHALKSSARIIGAAELSELARNLEEAGKNGDTEFIKKHTGELLDRYRGLDESLSGFDKKDQDLPPISPSALKEAYQTITEIAGSMDYGMMESILKDLRGYRLPKEDAKTVTDLEELLTKLDWDAILKIASKK